MSAGTTLNNYDITSRYNNGDYLNKRLDVLPEIDLSASIQLGKSTSIYTNYSYQESSPSMFQMLEYEDLSNPLYTTRGNKDLLTTQQHQLFFNFSNYDWQTRSGYYVYMGGNYNMRTVGQSESFDENYIGTSTYVNLNDTYTFWAGLNYNKSFKLTDKDKLTFSGGFNFNGGLNKGVLNEVMYSSKNNSFGPRINVTLDFDKKLTLQPSYSYSMNSSSYENFSVAKVNYFTHKAGFMLTSYWPKNVVFGSDINYTYNSNISDGFKKDYLLWNASLGYNFLNERFLAKVKVYDILNQNLSVRRTTTPTSIYDSEDTILKQYFMFSLTYKLEKFAVKKKSNFSISE